jgi:kynurenine formamidase
VAEQAIGLGRLPRRGAFYVCAPYKVQGQQAGIVRAFAFSPKGAPATGAEAPLRL